MRTIVIVCFTALYTLCAALAFDTFSKRTCGAEAEALYNVAWSAIWPVTVIAGGASMVLFDLLPVRWGCTTAQPEPPR